MIKKLTILTAAFLILSVPWLPSYGQQEKVEKKETEKQSQMQMGPDMMQEMMMNMKQAGVSQDMMRRWQVMMNTPIFMDSPCAVYGQADTLGLSEEQKKQLSEIENEARQKALAVLTPEQLENMGDIPEKPMSLSNMCKEMSKECPMMQMMHGK
jgi:hypothetical protein